MEEVNELNENDISWNYDKLRAHIGKVKGTTDPLDGIKTIFNEECRDLLIDTNLLKRLKKRKLIKKKTKT